MSTISLKLKNKELGEVAAIWDEIKNYCLMPEDETTAAYPCKIAKVDSVDQCLNPDNLYISWKEMQSCNYWWEACPNKSKCEEVMVVHVNTLMRKQDEFGCATF